MPPLSMYRTTREMGFSVIQRGVLVLAACAFVLIVPYRLHRLSAAGGGVTGAWLKSKLYESQYRKNIKRAYGLDLVIAAKKPEPAAWRRPHPSHQERLERYIEGLRKAPAADTVAFGDSLIDLPRERLRSVPSAMNFSINGSWAHQMAQMAADIRPVLVRTGRYEKIRCVIIGSLGGNPFLNHQPLDVTVRESLAALNRVRSLYPNARIIVYGIPPTVSLYVNLNAISFEAACYRWVIADRDAVILPLQRRFAGRFRLFPRAVLSEDGIHFSPLGAAELDDLLRRAKTAPTHSIVD